MATALTFKESAKSLFDSTLSQIAHSPKTKPVATIALVALAGWGAFLRETCLEQLAKREVDYHRAKDGSTQETEADQARVKTIKVLGSVDLAYLTFLTTTAYIHKDSIYTFISAKFSQNELSPKTKVITTLAFGVLSAISYYMRWSSTFKYIESERLKTVLLKPENKASHVENSKAAHWNMYYSDIALVTSLMANAVLRGSLLRK